MSQQQTTAAYIAQLVQQLEDAQGQYTNILQEEARVQAELKRAVGTINEIKKKLVEMIEPLEITTIEVP